MSDEQAALDEAQIRRRRLFRLVMVILPFILLEAGARGYWSLFMFKLSSEQELRTQLFWEGKWDQPIPYTFTPGMNDKVHETPTRINNIGFRGDRDIDPKSPRGQRILCVGDSVTFGYTVSGNKAAYPAQLEAMLTQKGRTVEVINGGMPRYRIEHMSNLFKPALPVLKPQIAVVLGGWNNVNDSILLEPEQGAFWSFVSEHVYVYKVADRIGVTALWRGTPRKPAVLSKDGLTAFKAQMTRLVRLLKQSSCQRVYLCSLPHFFEQLDSEAAKVKARQFTPRGRLKQVQEVVKTLNQILREVAKEQELVFVDLSTVNKAEWFGDAIHPNDEGSRRIAEIVAGAILQ